MISEWGVTPPSAAGWLKNTWWFVSHYIGRFLLKLIKVPSPQQQQQQQQPRRSLHDLLALRPQVKRNYAMPNLVLVVAVLAEEAEQEEGQEESD